MNTTVTTGRRIHLVTLLLGAFLFMLSANKTAFARTCTMFSPGAGAFEAGMVVIVRQATGDFFSDRRGYFRRQQRW